MSEALWRRRFGADPTLVGSTTRLGGRVVTVIGIMPADFNFDLPGASGGQRGVWTLLNPPASRAPSQRYAHYLQVIGRLKPDVALEAARADLRPSPTAIARESPATNKGHTATADRCCASASSGRAAPHGDAAGRRGWPRAADVLRERRQPVARTCVRTQPRIRSSSGARCRSCTDRSTAADREPRAGDIRRRRGSCYWRRYSASCAGADPARSVTRCGVAELRRPRLLFCLGASSVVAILCGLAPAWHAIGGSPIQALAVDGRSTTGSGSRLRRLLATSEVAVAVLLLCGAGLLLRTLLVLERVDPGTRSSDLLTMVVAGGSPSTPNTPEGMRRNYEAFAAEVEKVPGIRSIAWGSSLPFDGVWYLQAFQIDGDPPRSPGERDNAGYFIVSPSWLSGCSVFRCSMDACSPTATSLARHRCVSSMRSSCAATCAAATRWVRASRLTRWSSHHEW